MTLTNLRDYVYDYLKASSTQGEWAQSEIDRYIRDGELYLFGLVAARHEDFFRAVNSTLGETANTATVSLPTDCYRLLYLERIVGYSASTTNPLMLTKVDRNQGEISQLRGMAYPFNNNGTVAYPMHYMQQGQKTIELLPTPALTVANSLRITYVYKPAAMSSGSDEPLQQTAGASGSGKDSLSEFHDIIAKYALEMALSKEEGLPQAQWIKASRLEREEHVREYLNSVNAQSPRTISVTAAEWECW